MITLEEILNKICSEMHQTNKNYIKQVKEEDLIQFHSTLGRQIRNRFLLWDTDFDLLIDMGLPLDTCADGVSQKIIEALWKKLNDYPGTKGELK